MIDGRECLITVEHRDRDDRRQLGRAHRSRRRCCATPTPRCTAPSGQGRAHWHRFDDALVQEATRRFELEADLAPALDRGEFVLHYEPIHELAHHTIVGVEAFLRWEHPTRGFLRPGEFLEVAEQTGMIVPIGAWAMRAACAQARLWRDAGWPGWMSVNVSGRELAEPGLADTVATMLDETGVAARPALARADRERRSCARAVAATNELVDAAGARRAHRRRRFRHRAHAVAEAAAAADRLLQDRRRVRREPHRRRRDPSRRLRHGRRARAGRHDARPVGRSPKASSPRSRPRSSSSADASTVRASCSRARRPPGRPATDIASMTRARPCPSSRATASRRRSGTVLTSACEVDLDGRILRSRPRSARRLRAPHIGRRRRVRERSLRRRRRACRRGRSCTARARDGAADADTAAAARGRRRRDRGRVLGAHGRTARQTSASASATRRSATSFHARAGAPGALRSADRLPNRLLLLERRRAALAPGPRRWC